MTLFSFFLLAPFSLFRFSLVSCAADDEKTADLHSKFNLIKTECKQKMNAILYGGRFQKKSRVNSVWHVLASKKPDKIVHTHTFSEGNVSATDR